MWKELHAIKFAVRNAAGKKNAKLAIKKLIDIWLGDERNAIHYRHHAVGKGKKIIWSHDQRTVSQPLLKSPLFNVQFLDMKKWNLGDFQVLEIL